MSEFEQAVTPVDWDDVRSHLRAGDFYAMEATKLYLIIQKMDDEGYTPEHRDHLLRVVGRLNIAQHRR